MAEQAKRAPKKAPRMRLSQEQRERFLEVLGETGNRRVAAEAIGVEPRLMDQRRRFDRLLDRQWREALERAERRLAGAAGPLDTGREFNVIRKAPNGRTQIVMAGPKRWSKKSEARFLAALGMCGNVAAAARSVGFSEGCIWQRRRKFAAFAQAMEEVLEDAELRIEFRMAAMGSDIAAADVTREEDEADEEGNERPSTASTGSGQASLGTSGELGYSLPQAGGEVPFDPEAGFRFLKWRAAKRQGVPSAHRNSRLRATEEELNESILRKLDVLDRRRAKERIAGGWQQDEEGHWIPPGWVRAQPAGQD